MASPIQANGVHPSTPPATDPSAPNTAAQSRPELPPDAPRTSLQDSGEAKRPREARLIHLVLATMGINSYQERVPLQLLDFAYRYTSSVLSDSLRLSGEGYAGANEPRGRGRGAGGGAGAADAGSEGITLQSLRQAIASRQRYTFVNHLPKEWMLEQAEQHNKVALPKIETRAYGLQLPPEQYCLNGVGWGLKEEWSDEEDVRDEDPSDQTTKLDRREDTHMDAMDEDEMDEDEEGAGRMEDVFGEDDEGDAKMSGQE